MSKLQELLDIVEARGGNAEAVRNNVLDSMVALDASAELIAEAMLNVIMDDDREKAAKLESEGKG